MGVRSALHQVLKKRGIDPIPLDPWFYPTDHQYEAVSPTHILHPTRIQTDVRQLLSQHGLNPIESGLFPRPTPVPTGLKGWLATFARNTFLTGLDDSTAEEIIEEVEEICRVDMYWNNAHPGMGVTSSRTATGSDGSAEGQEGWEVMYVRLRGKATWPGE